MTRFLRSLFRRRSVVVQTYRVKPTRLKELQNRRHAQLAAEIGWIWPVYRDELGIDLERALAEELARDPGFRLHHGTV